MADQLPGLTEKERELLQRLMGSPLDLPQEFKQWLTAYSEIYPPQIPLAQVLGYSQSTPRIIDINPFLNPTAQVNWITVAVDTGVVFNGYKKSSGAQNDSISWDVTLTKGTWQFHIMHVSGPDCGIYTVTLDGVSIGSTFDGYQAAQAMTQQNLNNIQIPETKQMTLKVQMATKNASSSSYFGKLQWLRFQKTSDS